jgi:L-ascorbate metabolism protein UlaG (beta-lactamase superfamily)
MRVKRFLRSASAYAVCGLVFAALAGGAAVAQTMLDGDHVPTADLSQGGGFRGGDIVIHPVNHASFVMSWSNEVFYVDPVGGGDLYSGLPEPSLILITDVHGDHLDVETLEDIATEDTLLITPAAVAEMLPADLRERTKILGADGDAYALLGIGVKTVPMYNTTEERLQYHSPGRGNGYRLTYGPARVYVAGDTECTPEMRELSDIDVAFVPMNLPYTMDIDHAADAVKAFKPGIVYPYHYTDSDVNAFKAMVGDAADVRLLQWY